MIFDAESIAGFYMRLNNYSLTCLKYNFFFRLSSQHWSGILSLYNESVAGHHVAILPPILLSHRIAPELAAGIRNPDERDPPPMRWQALAAALDPPDYVPGMYIYCFLNYLCFLCP